MKHIILIGFKSVGKSAIGKELARQTGKPFVDLDEEVEKAFAENNGQHLTCRQIMLKDGQEAFRKLEHNALKQILQSTDDSVIALGGGTPMLKANRALVLEHKAIQITAPKSIVYERIMVNGRPAFFSPDEHPLESFNRIWEQRSKVYNELSKIKVENSGTIESAVQKIKSIVL